MRERRTEPRVPFQCPISIETPDGRRWQGQVKNLSHHGVLAKVGRLGVPLGVVRICIDAEDGTPPFTIETRGEVVRTDGKGGVSIHLQGPAEEDLEDLRYLIDMNLGVPTGCGVGREECEREVLYWYSRCP